MHKGEKREVSESMLQCVMERLENWKEDKERKRAVKKREGERKDQAKREQESQWYERQLAWARAY